MKLFERVLTEARSVAGSPGEERAERIRFFTETDLSGEMLAEGAIAFELRLTEKLIAGAFMRERTVDTAIVANVGRFGSENHWLDIKEPAIRSPGSIDR